MSSHEMARIEHIDPELTTLITQAMSGEEVVARAAFDQVFTHYSDTIWRHALGIVKRTEIAEEIRQQTFLNAWNNRATFDGGPHFAAWLYKIAHNLAIDYVRRSGNKVTDSIDDIEIAAQQASAFDEALKHEDRDRLRAALVQLEKISDPRVTFIIKEFYFHYKTGADIARELDLTIEDVNNILHRGRVKLRELLNLKTSANQASELLAPVDPTDKRAQLEAALAAMPNRDHARILRLSLLDNLPDKEIAAQVGRTPNAVSQVLSRQRRVLAEQQGGTLPEVHSVTPRLDHLLATDDSAHTQLTKLLQQVTNVDTVAVLRLALMEGLSGSAIADVTGEKVNTIRVRISRGKDQVEALLARQKTE